MDTNAPSAPRFNAADFFVDRNVREGRANKVVVYCEDRQFTYGQIRAMVNRFGNALTAIGVRMEERIAVLLPDSEIYAQVFFGAIKIGAVPICLNTLLKAEDYRYMLNDSRAQVLVVDASLIGAIDPLRGRLPFLKHIIVVGEGAKAGDQSLAELLDGQSDRLDPAPTGPDDVCFWLYSSGSTGRPKGTVHLHHDMVVCAQNYAGPILGIGENDITFSVAKLFFAYGLGNGLYFAFFAGAATVLSPQRPTPEHVFKTIHRFRPTLFFGVPTSYGALLQVPDARTRYDLGSIRHCVSAGESLPAPIFQQWKDTFGLEILDGIGSTEMAHIFLSNRPGAIKAGSSGTVVPGFEAKIVDDQGAEAPVGQVGGLMVKGDSAAACYWNKHEKTKATFVGEWVNTGDQYYRDEDGFFWYAGRGDDMIKAGGIWVSPIEVENALIAHSTVLECAVVGCADPEGLIKPKAYVVFKSGVAVTGALLDELKQFVKTSIAPYKFPRWIEPVGELPKTATGKIQRFKLRQEIAQPLRRAA